MCMIKHYLFGFVTILKFLIKNCICPEPQIFFQLPSFWDNDQEYNGKKTFPSY